MLVNHIWHVKKRDFALFMRKTVKYAVVINWYRSTKPSKHKHGYLRSKWIATEPIKFVYGVMWPILSKQKFSRSPTGCLKLSLNPKTENGPPKLRAYNFVKNWRISTIFGMLIILQHYYGFLGERDHARKSRLARGKTRFCSLYVKKIVNML